MVGGDLNMVEYKSNHTRNPSKKLLEEEQDEVNNLIFKRGFKI